MASKGLKRKGNCAHIFRISLLGLFQENLPGRHGTEPNFFHRGGRCSDSFSFLGRRGR